MKNDATVKPLATSPVVAPLGTGTTMLVAPQVPGVPAVPLNVTVLAPCAAAKFVPGVATDAPPTPLPAALNAAKSAAQSCVVEKVVVAEVDPALTCIWSSALSFVAVGAGTASSIV
jgi:hypothetical protein